MSKQSSHSDPTPAKKLSLPKLSTYYVGSLESAAHRKMRAFKDKILKPYGLSSTQWYIVGSVYDTQGKGTRITDLSRQLGTNQSYMTNSVNALVAKGVLQRHDSGVDNRAKIVVIADGYGATVEEIEAKMRAGLREKIYKHISSDELKAYIKTLYALAGEDGGE